MDSRYESANTVQCCWSFGHNSNAVRCIALENIHNASDDTILLEYHWYYVPGGGVTSTFSVRRRVRSISPACITARKYSLRQSRINKASNANLPFFCSRGPCHATPCDQTIYKPPQLLYQNHVANGDDPVSTFDLSHSFKICGKTNHLELPTT